MIAAPARRSRILGLTLVEILIALVLLAVVLLPVMVGFSQALVSTSNSTITAAASSIARDKLEELKNLSRQENPFDKLQAEDGKRETKHLNPGDGFFEVAVSVTGGPMDPITLAGLKQAVVSVYRRGGSNPVVVITTYFTPVGI